MPSPLRKCLARSAVFVAICVLPVACNSGRLPSSPRVMGGGTLAANAGGPYASQPNTAITFSANASGGVSPYSYAWDFGDSTTGTGQTPSHSYANSETYTVSLTVTDASKAQARASAQVAISSGGPLLQLSDFTYLGSFRLPQGASGIDPQGFSFSSGALSGTVYQDPIKGPSLFVSCYLDAGYIYDGVSVAQVSIPPLLDPNVVGLDGLNTATLLQPCSDPSAPNADPLAGGYDGICTFLALPGDLLGFCAASYDANANQPAAAFVGTYNFASPNGAGPYVVGGLRQTVYGGYAGMVPTEWRTALGGDIFAGNGNGMSIISANSNGPALSVMKSGDFLARPAPGTAIASTVLAFYDTDHSQLGTWNSNLPGQVVNGIPVPTFTVTDPRGRTVPNTGNGTGPTWTIPAASNANANRGALFANNTSSVIYFGRLGLGPYCYGEGTSDPALIGQSTSDGSIYCYDPDVGDKGDHAYPYTHAAWAFNVNDYVAVAQGRKDPSMVLPYALWPFPTYGAGNNLGGVAWDPQNRLLYLAVPGADPGDGGFFSGPLINVYRVH